MSSKQPTPGRDDNVKGLKRVNDEAEVIPLKGKKMIGNKIWAIAEGYIPSYGTGPKPQLESHETACILNTGEQDAHVIFTIYFSNKDPVGPYHFVVAAQRTRHIRFNDFTDPMPIPKDTDYACLIESDVPIVVQHTRIDTRQAENALFSTMAFAV